MPSPQNPYALRSSANQQASAEQQPSTSNTQADNQQYQEPAERVVIPVVAEEGIILQHPQPNRQQIVEVSDMNQSPAIQMPCFHGNPGERGDEWVSWYLNFAEALSYNDTKRRLLMPFYFRDHAKAWYDSLDADVKTNWDELIKLFKDRFNGNDGVGSDMAVFNIKQNCDESCASYFTRFIRATTNRKYSESLMAGVVLNGLKPSIKAIVMPQDPQTVEAVRKFACLAERTVAETAVPNIAAVSDDTAINVLTKRLEEVIAINDGLRKEIRTHQNQQQQTWSQRRRRYQQQQHPTQSPQHPHQQQPSQPRSVTQTTRDNWQCIRCAGRTFHISDNCPAINEICHQCGIVGHFKRICQGGRRSYNR